MGRNVWIAVTLSGLISTVHAQVLQYDPGKSVVVTGFVTDADNPHGVITFTNQLASDSAYVAWAVVENSYNPAWKVVFCTDICYTAVKPTGQYPPLAPGASAFVSVDVTPNGAADTGVLRIRLYDYRNNAFSDTISVEMRIGQGSTGWGETPSRAPLFRQSGRTLYFTPDLRNAVVEVYSLTGQRVRRMPIRQHKADLYDIPSGIYFIRVIKDGIRPRVVQIYVD